MPINRSNGQLFIQGEITSSAIKEIKNTFYSEVVLSSLHASNADVLFRFFEFLGTNPQIKKISLVDISKESIYLLEKALEKRETEITIILSEKMTQSEEIHEDIFCDNTNLTLIKIYGDWQVEFHKLEKEKIEHHISQIFMSFYYKKQMIFQLTACDDNLTDIIIGDEINSTVSIPDNIPLEKFVKQFVHLRNNCDYQKLIARDFTNYFHGPLIDYLDYRLTQGVLIGKFTSNNFEPLYQDLKIVFTKEGIEYSEINPGLWFRDFVICKGDGHQLLHTSHGIPSEIVTKAEDIASFNANSYISTDYFLRAIGGSARKEKDSKKQLLTYCKKNQINYEKINTSLDGGNLITVIKNNQIYVLVGEDVLALDACYRTHRNYNDRKFIATLQKQYEKKQSLAKNYTFYKKLADSKIIVNRIHKKDKITPETILPGHFKEAKMNLANLFNLSKKQIISIPNAEFHIDLYLIPGPDDIIFLNNFLLVANLALDDYLKTKNPLSKEIALIASEYAEKLSPIYDAIKKKLIDKGFKVVDLPGLLPRNPTKGSKKLNAKIDSQYVANYINSFTGFGKNGHYFITIPGPIESINLAVEKILRENKVNNVYFVGNSKIGKKLLNHDGSIRCLSIPGSYYGNLGSTHSFFKQMNLPKTNTTKINSVNNSNPSTDPSKCKTDDRKRVNSPCP